MQFPMLFKSETEATADAGQTWQTTSGPHSSCVAIPPEFSGPGGGLSPEDLFNHALTNCFVATFKVYAKNSRLTFDSVHAHGDLVVDLDENRKPVMKSFKLRAQISGASDRDKALLLANKAAKSGFILNSVKTACEFDIQVSGLESGNPSSTEQ
jgi:organic hydroperoxide reductase OsmC/OhrA